MTDTRTLQDKLRAMAEQDVSPHEAEIARAKLDALAAAPPLPPHRPPAVGAPSPMPFDWQVTFTTSTAGAAANAPTWFVFRIGGWQQ